MASLVADYGTSSSEKNSDSESSESDVDVKEEDDTKIPPNITENEKLPAPQFGNKTNSVFTNPFKEEEQAKQAILEHHVKMVNTTKNIKTLNGKKICWNYRKGKCRFGTKCTFAHDSDLQKTDEELQEVGKVQHTVLFQENQMTPPEKIVTKECVTKKKRPGLTQGLVPGKKVMKMYKSQSVSSSAKK